MKKVLLSLSILMSLLLSAEYSHAQYQDNSNNPTVTVSPNPFDDELTITIAEGGKKVSSIHIFDLIGKEVAFIDLKNKSGNLSYRLDFSKLRPGVYFCNVYSDTGIIETKKIFKTTGL